MTQLTLLLKELKTQWSTLKDESAPKVDRRLACKKIIELTNEVKKLDPTFEVIDLSTTQYAEFMPADLRVATSVNWDRPDFPIPKHFENAVKLAFDMEEIAVAWTKFRLPHESVETQKFGMITNANTEKLLKAFAITK